MPFHKDLTGTDLHESKIPVFDSSDVQKGVTFGKSVKDGQNITIVAPDTSGRVVFNISGQIPIANGGTGASTVSSGVVVSNGTVFSSITQPSTDLVGIDDIQILTNKTLNGSTNDISANKLRGMTEVLISTSTTPADGYSLVYNGGLGEAEWSLISDTTGTWREETYTATGGQTVFPLAHTPIQILGVLAYVNGIFRDQASDYGVSGSTATFTFSLLAGDRVTFKYQS